VDKTPNRSGKHETKEKHESDFENDKKSTQITLDAFRKSKLRKV
jgi:hypothetical protein